ncbi:hypothetical protein BJ165DRAFT_848877 [Panaeolus papilionaceus]|nr:hypothetical protein BJ165DRAFT_848877 [Panaeolus papilionaceus]
MNGASLPLLFRNLCSIYLLLFLIHITNISAGEHGCTSLWANVARQLTGIVRALLLKSAIIEIYHGRQHQQPGGFNHHHHLINTRHFNLTKYARHRDLGDPIAGTFAYIESKVSCWSDGCQ